MRELLGLFSGLLAASSYIPYTRDILKKKAQPERATWLIWSVLASIAFISQLSKGARQSLWFTGLDSAGTFLTFALAIRFGLGSLKKRDTIALLLAGFGLVLWYFTHNAIYALLITVVVDAIGTGLTVWKTFEHPDTETYLMWALVCVAGLLAVASIGTFNATLILYPCYIFVANFSVIVAIFLGRKLARPNNQLLPAPANASSPNVALSTQVCEHETVMSTLLFQYCQKLVILSADKQSVLLAKRKGEADYDGTFSFVGGKMETTDESLVAGMKREKDEEIGAGVRINIIPDESLNVLFRKADGNSMVLPHIAGVYISGDIYINDEYSEYRWVPLSDLGTFEPKIANIPEMARWAAHKLSEPDVRLVEI